MKSVSSKKQELINSENSKERKVGDSVVIKEGLLPHCRDDRKENDITVKIKSINGDKLSIYTEDYKRENIEISFSDILRVSEWDIGVNPFTDNDLSVRFVAFSLDSILFALNICGDKRGINEGYKNKSGYLIKDLNWNPYVIGNDGEKQYYQRGFVWSLEENQLLIESIYQRIECGRILARKRSWDEVDKMQEDAAFHDIVDGKQRLNAIRGFINGEFPDLQGNYYGDLSYSAQHQFTNHQLFTYAEMQENTEDLKVLQQFLKLNFAGMPQSKEHIEHVKALYNNLK